MRIDIVGAGMAGLLAANMLRHHSVAVVERQPSLPNNHSAVLRFRSPVVGDVLGIPFRKVTVVKTALPWRNPVADALAYSLKNTGLMRSDRSIIDGDEVVERFIAPPDFIQCMASRLQLCVDMEYDFASSAVDGIPAISTIPMPALMELLDYPGREKIDFGYRPGWNIKATLRGVEAYVSVTVPDPTYAFSRVSITGSELIIELPGLDDITEEAMEHMREKFLVGALHLLGLGLERCEDIRSYRQRYAKILPIDDAARREFIYWASHEHGVYSLGRYATWRPKLLLDDLVKDIRLIEGWISRADNYAMARAR